MTRSAAARVSYSARCACASWVKIACTCSPSANSGCSSQSSESSAREAGQEMLLVHPRRVREAQNGAVGRENATHGLAPRLGASFMQHGVAFGFQFLGCARDRLGAFNLELDTDLGNGAIARPLVRAEASLCRFDQ